VNTASVDLISLTCGVLYARIILAFFLLSFEQLASPAPKRKRNHCEPDRAQKRLIGQQIVTHNGALKISNQITPKSMDGASSSLLGQAIPHISLCSALKLC